MSITKLIQLPGASHLVNLESRPKMPTQYQNDLNSVIKEPYECRQFSNGEWHFRLIETVRNCQVVLLQCFNNVNEDLIQLLLAVDAVKHGGAEEVVVVLPMFPYSRQDRMHKSGVPISAKLICDLLVASGVDRIVTTDLHNDAIQGFVSSHHAHFDHVELTSFLAFNLKKKLPLISDYVFVSPDAGAVKRTTKLMEACGSHDMVIMTKTRSRANIVDNIQLIGEVEGRDVIIVDDMCDTGGTMVKAVDELINRGSKSQCLVFSHGVFSGPAYKNMDGLRVFCTNSLMIPEYCSDGYSIEELTVFDLSPFLRDLFARIADGRSLGPLFKYNNIKRM